MRCKICGVCTNQIEKRHSWVYQHCSSCHYLGLRRPYSDLHSNKKKELREKLKQ